MNKQNIIFFVVILMISTCVFWGFIQGHYSTDDYNIMNIGYNEYSIRNNLREGRPIMYFIDQIALKFSIDYNVFISTTVCLAIIITSLTVIVFYNIVIKYLNNPSIFNKIIILLCSYTIIFNFMYVENLYYVESIVMSMALLIYLISAVNLVEKKNYKVAIILAIVANFCYNGFQCYYITVVFLISILSNGKDYKNIIKDFFTAGGIIVFSVVLNLIQIKICGNYFNIPIRRLGNTKSITSNILYIIYGIPLMVLTTANLFPGFLYLIFILYLIMISILCSNINNDLQITVKVFLSILVSILSCFCIFLFTLSSFGTGRLMYGLGMTIGMGFLILFMYNKNKHSTLIVLIFLIYFAINIANSIYMVNLSKKVNYLEKNEVENIEKELAEYEENNINVNKIAYIYNSKKPVNHYKEIKNKSCITDRALGCEWACCGTINFYTNRNMKVIPTTEEILKEYKTNNNKLTNGMLIYKDVLICPVSTW